jgi:hypothetical protein
VSFAGLKGVGALSYYFSDLELLSSDQIVFSKKKKELLSSDQIVMVVQI